MRKVLLAMTFGLSTVALAIQPSLADDISGDDVAGDETNPEFVEQLAVGSVESGVYDFCLSFEDARVRRDYLLKAITNGMSVGKYRKTRPRTRCYRNKLTFVPIEPTPALDGIDFVFVADPRGDYPCPKGVKAKAGGRCALGTRNTRIIKADILYSKMRFPIYVQLSGQELVGQDGEVLVGR